MRQLALAAIAFVLSSTTSYCWANDQGRFIVDEENDTFSSSDDRHYTQGIQFQYVSGDMKPDSDWNLPFDVLPPLDRNGKRKYAVILGQSLFTPANLHLANPDPRDRPYAGWLYGGLGLLQEHDGHGLENLELLAGVVGPTALGKQTQNDVHDFIQIGEAHGWSNQLHDEAGVVLSYDRKWRFEQPLTNHLSIDLVPEAGVSLGNVFTYAAAGGRVRFGHNLGAEYGHSQIRPSLSGSGWFDVDRMNGDNFRWNLFAGVQGRAMGRNIFLDGNTFRDSHHVDKKPLVGDFVFGVSAFWTDAVHLDFAITNRSKEFYGQPFKDRFATIDLTIRF